MKTTFLALAGAALLLSASASAAGSSQPKKVIVPAVQAKARAINVHLSDLPASMGFVSKPSSPDTGTPRCSYYNPDQSDLTENGDAKSPEFTLTSGASAGSYISSSIGIFKTAAQGRTAYARVIQPKLPLCLAELFKTGGGSGVTIMSSKAIDFPKLAERTNAYRIAATVKSGKQKVRVYVDVVVMNRAKVDAVVFFAGIGNFFNSAFEHAVASKVAARSANA